MTFNSNPTPSAPAAAKETMDALGIGLGAGLGGGALLALVVGWYTWHRRKRANAAAASTSGSSIDGRKEMADQEIAEKGSKERYEIQDKEPPIEVAGDMFRAELSATSERTENRF